MFANANYSIVQLAIQIKSEIMKHVSVSVKIFNRSKCFCENGKHLKIISDDSKIVCDETICVMDIVSRKLTNTLASSTVNK